MPDNGTLRERRAAATREATMRAAAALSAAATSLDDVTMPEIAERAGVSLRTLYRYYPDRAALESSLASWIAENVILAPLPTTPAEVAGSMADVAPSFEENLDLVRVLVRTRVGQAVRSPRRRERVAAIEQALEPLLTGRPEREQRRVTAVVTLLASAHAWLDLRDESGLTGEEAGQTLSWAIGALIDATERSTT